MYERYGIPIAIVCTLSLLLASDIGSGVSVVRVLVPSDDMFEKQTDELLTASVFTSLKSLWNAGSYGLVIFIALTSISWPYVKMLLTLYAWMTPFTNHYRRRERLLEWLDRMGKWSFVDIVVFLEITVVFKSTIDLGGPVIEVYVVPRWGIYGFLTATMLSLIWTQISLRRHRKLIYRPIRSDDNVVKGVRHIGELKSRSIVPVTFLLVASFAMYMTGVILYIFELINLRGETDMGSVDYSIVSVGMELSNSAIEGTEGRMRWLQIVWFLLGVVFPLLSIVICCILLYIPLSKARLEKLFFWAEISFAWNSAEVFALSTIVAVLEIPTFGNGLIKSGCATCYVVDSTLLPTLAVLLVGTCFTMAAAFWLFTLVHRAIYDGRLKQ